MNLKRCEKRGRLQGRYDTPCGRVIRAARSSFLHEKTETTKMARSLAMGYDTPCGRVIRVARFRFFIRKNRNDAKSAVACRGGMILPAVVSYVRRVPVFLHEKQKRREKRGRLQGRYDTPCGRVKRAARSSFLHKKTETTQTPGLRRFRMIRGKINELN